MSLYAKRLEPGRFIWPSPADSIVAISAAQLAYILDPLDRSFGRLGCGLVVARFAAAMTFGRLRGVAERYAEGCAAHGNRPSELKCSYFMHFADNKGEEEAARARQIRCYKECVIPGFPSDPETTPASAWVRATAAQERTPRVLK